MTFDLHDFDGGMMGLKTSRRLRKVLSWQNVGLALLCVVTAGVVAFTFMPRTPPPMSAPVRAVVPLPTKAAPTPKGSIAAVGDSFASDKATWWPAVLGSCTNNNVTVTQAGGSGFVAKGDGVPYGDPSRVAVVAAAKPSLIVFITAYNDSWRADYDQPAVEAKVVETLRAYKAAVPDAKMLVVGPFWAKDPKPTNILNNRAALIAATAAEGVPYLDATPWVWAPEQLGKDGMHPNDAGHRDVIARNMLAELVRLGYAEDLANCFPAA